MVEGVIWSRPHLKQDGLRAFILPGLVDLKLCFLLQGSDRQLVYAANVPAPWSFDPSQDVSLSDIFGRDIAERLDHAIDRLNAPGDKTVVEILASGERIFEFRLQAVSVDGGEVHYLTSIVDRSEDRHRERQLKALLREVSHRSKNLLAIIQSLALQTARHSRSLDLFLQKFRGRLYSLSQSQDLITDSNWRGAGIFSLVRDQTEKYLPENSDLVRIEGEDFTLTPNASLHLGLALHELVVNAVIHGGLVVNGQLVTVTCRRTKDASGAHIEVTWHEPLSPSCALGDAREVHFGSTVLERVVPVSVNGTAQYSISDDGILYRLQFPDDGGADSR